MFAGGISKATLHSCPLPPFTEWRKQFITAQLYPTPLCQFSPWKTAAQSKMNFCLNCTSQSPSNWRGAIFTSLSCCQQTLISCLRWAGSHSKQTKSKQHTIMSPALGLRVVLLWSCAVAKSPATQSLYSMYSLFVLSMWAGKSWNKGLKLGIALLCYNPTKGNRFKHTNNLSCWTYLIGSDVCCPQGRSLVN